MKLTHSHCADRPMFGGLIRPFANLSLVTFLLFAASVTMSAQSDQTYEQLTAAHPGWVQVPGQLMRPDCVHEIPKGARVEISAAGQITGDVTLNGQVIAHYDSCPEAPIPTRRVAGAEDSPKAPLIFHGRIEGAQENLALAPGDNIDWQTGQLWVPNAPKVNGALIYIYNGIGASGQDWILEPVLQYGKSPAGGGNYWAIASWLVGTGGAWVSPVVKVHSGNRLQLYTQQTGSKGGTLYWRSEAYDLSTRAYSWIAAWSSGLHWTWAYEGVLEAYYVNSCSQLPASGYVHFFYNYVYHGYPNYYYVPPAFNGWIYQYGCGNWIDVNNSSDYLYLHF